MSDPTNLETTVAAEPVTPTTAGITPTPVPLDDETREQAHTDQRGQQVVPVATLLETRAAMKQARAEAKAASEKAQQLEQAWSQWAPYAQALASRPDLLTALSQPAQPAREAAPTPQSDPVVEALANKFGLYTSQGSPDSAAINDLIRAIEDRVTSKINEVVRPVQEQSKAAQAAIMRQQAVTYAQATGYASPQMLEQVLGMIPVELQADENVMRLALVLAKGLEASQGASAPAAAPPATAPTYGAPLVTEPAGRRGGPPPLSDMEQRIAQSRGISPEKWRKLSDTNSLEVE